MKSKKFTRAFRNIINQLHLYLGLIAGVVIVISFSAAAIFVWDEELTDLYYGDYVFVKEAGEERLAPSKLLAILKEELPGGEFTSISIKNDPKRSAVFSRSKKAENPGISWWSTVDYYDKAYVNPYNGEILGVIDMRYNWIYLTRRLHQNLWLNPKIGTQILAYAALIMIIMALTGLYLWMPKSWKRIKAYFTINWRAPWKKINWDVHTVGGFYTHLFILFFAATGLMWAFDWWKEGTYRLLGDDPKEVFARPEHPQLTGADKLAALDIAYLDAMERRPNWRTMSLRIPAATKSEGVLTATLKFDHESSWWDTSDQFAYHPETGAFRWDRTHDEKLTSEKFRNSNYEMHTGGIYGWPTKIIASFCALFFATLPITGFSIWLSKRKRKRKVKPINKKEKEKERVLESIAE